jgi:hypothetical protein
MKFRNPWIDPRIVDVRPEDARTYLLNQGWKPLGPAGNPDLLRFEATENGEEPPTVLLPLQIDHGPMLQRMIDLVGEVALFEERYAGEVLNDMLRIASLSQTNGACAEQIQDLPHSS